VGEVVSMGEEARGVGCGGVHTRVVRGVVRRRWRQPCCFHLRKRD
jgi:hypothetical protein